MILIACLLCGTGSPAEGRQDGSHLTRIRQKKIQVTRTKMGIRIIIA